jgi:argininosuccinate lyase
MLQQASVKKDLLADPKFDHLFSVEAVNKLVQSGVPFREAYKQVGRSIESGEFIAPRDLSHMHEGSMGNLCNKEIRNQYQRTRDRFEFQLFREQIDRLLHAP